MRVASWAILAVAPFLFIGCGEAESDRVAKETIRLINEEAREWEFLASKPTSKDDLDRCMERMANIKKQKDEVTAAQKKIPVAEWKAAQAKYKSEFEQAVQHFVAARKQVIPMMKIETKEKGK